MVTKFDAFLEIYSKSGPRRIVDIVKGLDQPPSAYDRIRKILGTLISMKRIAKSRHGYEPIRNAKNQHLFNLLSYCVKNGVNYNEILDSGVAMYLSKAFLKKSFTGKDINVHPKTFAKVSRALEKNGLLIVLSRKPFRAAVPYNSLLGDVLAYFGHKPMVARKNSDDFIVLIEKELSKFRKLRNRNSMRYREVLENFQIRFIHHSLSIEGNPITLAQTFKLLREKIVPENVGIESVNEVQNYQKAFIEMIRSVKDNAPLTKESILNYHYIALSHIPEYAGRFRDGDVYIKGNKDFSVAPFKDIEKLLDLLLGNYNLFVREKKHSLRRILDFSAYLHNEFQHIHPFFDGNSRTTRLITFQFLQMNGIPIFDIPLGMLESYVLSTKGSKKREDNELMQALGQIILYNLKSINEKLHS